MKTQSKKISSKAQRRTGISGWVSRIGRTKAIIIAVFILIFAGGGTLTLNGAHAAIICVNYTFYEGVNSSQCVKDIQFGLQRLGYYQGNIDGIYGPQTYAAVLKFGYANGYNNNGKVGIRTWGSLCSEGWDYPSVSRNMGCGIGVSN